MWTTFRDNSLASGHWERVQVAKSANSPTMRPSAANCSAIVKAGSGSLLLVGHVSQFQDGFGFELSDSFAGDIDLATDLGKGQWLFSIQSKAKSQDFLFPFIEL